MKFARDLLLLLIGAVIGNVIMSHAGPTVEIGLGTTRYHTREDGTWYQSNALLQTHNDLESYGYRLGARWDVSDNWSLRASWVNLGHYYGDNEFVEDRSARRSALNCPADGSDCKMRGKISGGAYGLTFGPVLRWNMAGFQFQAEAGLYIYRSQQNTVICAEEYGGTDHPKDGCWNYNVMYGMHRTPYAGVSIGQGPLSLQYVLFHNVYEQGNHPGGDAGLTGRCCTQAINLTWSF